MPVNGFPDDFLTAGPRFEEHLLNLFVTIAVMVVLLRALLALSPSEALNRWMLGWLSALLRLLKRGARWLLLAALRKLHEFGLYLSRRIAERLGRRLRD